MLELAEFLELKNYNWSNAIKSFSAIYNTRILFSIQTNENKKTAENEQFQFIHGIRMLASFLTIYFHTTDYTPVKFGMKVALLARYPQDLQNFTTNTINISLIAHILVQAFFLMR